MKEVYYFNSSRVKDTPFSIGGINREWDREVKLHINTYNELLDSLDVDSVLDTLKFQKLVDNNLSFYVKVVSRNPLSATFQGMYYLIDLHISYVNRQITCYVEKDYIEDLLKHHDGLKG